MKVGVLKTSRFLIDESNPSFLHCTAFRNKPITLVEFDTLEEMKQAILSNQIENFILICKSSTNHVSPLFADFVYRNDRIVEIGAFCIPISVYEVRKKENTEHPEDSIGMVKEHSLIAASFSGIQDDPFQRVDYSNIFEHYHRILLPINRHKDSESQFEKLGFLPPEYEHEKQSEGELEFRVFEKNQFRNNPWRTFLLFLCASLRGITTTIGSITVSMLIIIIGFIINFVILKDDPVLGNAISVITSGLAIILQILSQSKALGNALTSLLMKGKWIYYSVPVDKAMDKAIPFGFTTRIFDISLKNHEIAFAGGIINRKESLCVSRGTSVDIEEHQKAITGFYEFTYSQDSAGDSHQVEGMVRFYGKRKHILEPFYSLGGWFVGRKTKIIGNLRYIRISEEQYELLSSCDGYLKTHFRSSITSRTTSIGVFGSPHSQTHLAALSKFGNYDGFLFYKSAYELVNGLVSGETQLIIIPIANSITGEVEENVELIKGNMLTEIGRTKRSICFCLASKHGVPLSEIRSVCSHHQAYMQCEKVLKENNLSFTNTYILNDGNTIHIMDSSTAASRLNDQKDDSIAVLCTKKAAEDNGLDILMENAAPEEDATIFGIYVKTRQ